MTKQKNDKFLILIFFIIIFAFISALLIEYIMGHQPCKLCIYQRIPYVLSIFLIILAFLYKKYKKNILLVLSLTFAASAILAFYHFGIEQGFFNESQVCNTNNKINSSSVDLLKELKEKVISCKDVTFKLVGLSLATINTLFSSALSAIFLLLFVKNEKNK
mgnify:CR=1 FL=1|tara:strand:+ start:635 stop:1117 length:483 start_codon:yes stop_codon:yes gene_type:complete